MGKEKEELELKELKKQNKKLRGLVELYNQGHSNIVMCNKCGIPLGSEENRVRAVLNIRGNDYTTWRERQIGVFHIRCWKDAKRIKEAMNR